MNAAFERFLHVFGLGVTHVGQNMLL